MPHSSRGCHNGHRSRMRDKVLNFGPESLSDHELLEALLFFCLPRINTNEIAHHLYSEIGSLDNLFTADEARLKSVKGIGKKTVFFISLLGELFKRITYTPHKSKVKFDSMSTVNDFLLSHYAGVKEEQFCALFLDGQLRLLKFVVFSKGSISTVGINPRAVAYEAAKQSAACVIIAHNHPGGYAAPSEEDHAVTERIRSTLSAIDVPLIEHVIVGENRCIPTMKTDCYDNLSGVSDRVELDEKFYSKFYENQKTN